MISFDRTSMETPKLVKAIVTINASNIVISTTLQSTMSCIVKRIDEHRF